jgi:hypothetical protein
MTPPLWILVVFFACIACAPRRSAYFFLDKSKDETWRQWWKRIGA